MKKYYSKKVEACKQLVDLNCKKVNKTHIISVANKVGLPVYMVELAWKNFQETGGKFVDKSSKNGNGRSLMPMTPSVTATFYKERPLLPKEAAELVLEYMQDRNINSRQLSNNYRIPIKQFYKIINELNVSGTICGKMVLNHKKYAKINVLDAIWLYKRPETKRKSIAKLSATEKLAYERVGDVLVHYLKNI